jgi:hypothetical protein
MPVVKFLKDTVHPDHGYVTKGEVLRVARDYVRDYENLGIAEEVEQLPDEREPVSDMPRGWGKNALPESGAPAGGDVSG